MNSNIDTVTHLVDECCAKLMEHCDSVRIFATFHQGESGDTVGHTNGGGNLYSQLGLVREWLITQDQHVRNKADRDDRDED